MVITLSKMMLLILLDMNNIFLHKGPFIFLKLFEPFSSEALLVSRPTKDPSFPTTRKNPLIEIALFTDLWPIKRPMSPSLEEEQEQGLLEVEGSRERVTERRRFTPCLRKTNVVLKPEGAAEAASLDLQKACVLEQAMISGALRYNLPRYYSLGTDADAK